MIILPRIEWTAQVCRLNPGSDIYNDLPYYRVPPVGIRYVGFDGNVQFRDLNPRLVFEELLGRALSKGKSDVDHNLGVAGNVSGIWNLRGIHNKSSYHPNSFDNDQTITVCVLIGAQEKPTDQLLRNIVDSRRVVLSRYPTATQVFEFAHNPYLKEILGKSSFWQGVAAPAEFDLPDFHLEAGMQNVHVQELQEVLAYWRYYTVRIDGIYNQHTVDAVTNLACDLKAGGYYHYNLDGVFSDRLRRAWLKYIET